MKQSLKETHSFAPLFNLRRANLRQANLRRASGDPPSYSLNTKDISKLTSFQIHGTYRQKDRIYNEDTFFGQGKSIKDATEEELKTDLTERVSENPLAYSGNKLHFELTEEDIIQKKAL